VLATLPEHFSVPFHHRHQFKGDCAGFLEGGSAADRGAFPAPAPVPVSARRIVALHEQGGADEFAENKGVELQVGFAVSENAKGDEVRQAEVFAVWGRGVGLGILENGDEETPCELARATAPLEMVVRQIVRGSETQLFDGGNEGLGGCSSAPDGLLQAGSEKADGDRFFVSGNRFADGLFVARDQNSARGVVLFRGGRRAFVNEKPCFLGHPVHPVLECSGCELLEGGQKHPVFDCNRDAMGGGKV
jgi:hypothetical protein